MTTNVVILGAGLSGSACAVNLVNNTKKFPNVDITLVDVRSSSILKYAGTRSAVLGDKFAYRACIPNSSLIPSDKGRVINKFVTKINVENMDNGAGSIIVSSGNGGEEKTQILKYDFLVCATGAVNVSPCEPPLSMSFSNVFECVGWYQGIAREVQKAQWILVLGSGAVGTELAGEIKSNYPDKKVAILSPGATLVDGCFPPPSRKFYSRLEEIAAKLGIDLYLGQKAKGLKLADFNGNAFLSGARTVMTTGGQTIETDLILLCTGKKLNNEIYPKDWLNEDGLITVQNTLQVMNYKNIFAIGDINDVEENKQGYFAQKQGKLAAKNIEMLIKNADAKLKTYAPSPKTQIIVPLGKKYGASYLGGIVFGSRFTSELKGKDLFVKQHWGLYKQQKLLIKEGDANWQEKAESTYPAPGKPGLTGSPGGKKKSSMVPELNPEYMSEVTMGKMPTNSFNPNMGNMMSPIMKMSPKENDMENEEFNYDRVMQSAELSRGEFKTQMGKFGFDKEMEESINKFPTMKGMNEVGMEKPGEPGMSGTNTMMKKKRRKKKKKRVAKDDSPAMDESNINI